MNTICRACLMIHQPTNPPIAHTILYVPHYLQANSQCSIRSQAALFPNTIGPNMAAVDLFTHRAKFVYPIDDDQSLTGIDKALAREVLRTQHIHHPELFVTNCMVCPIPNFKLYCSSSRGYSQREARYAQWNFPESQLLGGDTCMLSQRSLSTTTCHRSLSAATNREAGHAQHD